MIKIELFKSEDFPFLVECVAAIQEHERDELPELKPGQEIAQDYTSSLVHAVEQKGGVILLAKNGTERVGFVSAWPDTDNDPCFKEEFRKHAYISDIYIIKAWRGRGLARKLLGAIESAMRDRGCLRVRICAKATNISAVNLYKSSGYNPYEIIFSKVTTS